MGRKMGLASQALHINDSQSHTQCRLAIAQLLPQLLHILLREGPFNPSHPFRRLRFALFFHERPDFVDQPVRCRAGIRKRDMQALCDLYRKRGVPILLEKPIEGV